MPWNARILPIIFVLVFVVFIFGYSSLAAGQQASPSSKPQVKVNMLNVCTPSREEQQQISTALAHIPKQPLFSRDFEVDRGRSTLDQQPNLMSVGQVAQPSSLETDSAAWVRIRREFGVQAWFSTVQYSFSEDPKSMIETLVFRVRDPKDLMQVSIEDDASSVTSPAAMLGTNTPVTRIRLERFGKSSVVLARCFGTADSPPPDQSAYESLFQAASSIDGNYRKLLDAPQMVPDELDRVNAAHSAAPSKRTGGNKSGIQKKNLPLKHQ